MKKDYLKLFDQAWPLMNGNLFQKLQLLVTGRGWRDGVLDPPLNTLPYNRKEDCKQAKLYMTY